MKVQLLALGLATLAISALSVGGASAYDRQTSVTTWRGTYTKSVDASCAEGTCVRNSTATGPDGATLVRSGKCMLVSPGVYQCNGTTTGPNGRKITRDSTVTVTGY